MAVTLTTREIVLRDKFVTLLGVLSGRLTNEFI